MYTLVRGHVGSHVYMQVSGRRQQALGYVHRKSHGSVSPLETVGHLGVQLHPVLPISPHTH